MFDAKVGWHGYADAKPSESIQKHDLPGLAVAVAFPHKPGEQVLQFPIKQYKDYKRKQKADRARQLAEWLIAQKKLGLVLTGFMHAHTQVAAATLGLELIEELPNTRVERHHDTYRLFFSDEYVDFAQAVALQYYFFTISFGILRAATRIPSEHRKLFVAMDRFPGADTNDAEPGEPIPPTQGAKFIEFVRTRSKTGMGLLEENRSINLESNLGSLDWWQWKGEDTWNKGKSHPHFVLPDWLAAAAIAHEFHDDFVETFDNERNGVEAAEALKELYDVFKTFDFWSMDSSVLTHIRAAEKRWNVPDDARDFILARAESNM
jgi:hypothetical protein